MPNVSTYVRTEDYDKYLSIQTKGDGAWTEFIHQSLNPTMAATTVRLLEEDFPATYKPCVHNADPMMCRYAKGGKKCNVKSRT